MLFMLSFFCAALGLLWLFLDSKKPKNYPPGPGFWPIIGNLLHFKSKLKEKHYHHLVWQELYQKFGEVVGLKMGRNLVVCAFGPEAVMQVLTREEFDGRPDGFFFRLRTFGKRLGIVFADGQFWQKQRRFSVQHLKNFGLGRREMEERIQDETRDFVNILKQSKEPILMHNAFDVSVLNALWAMMAGQRFEYNDQRLKKLLAIIHDAFRLTDMSGGLLNQMPFLRYIIPNACGYTEILQILNRMWEFLEETINEHKKTVNNWHARDLIDAFLQKMNVRNDPTFTNDQLMSLCLDLFMAGSETTSNTLSFAVIYMILYPEVQRKVQEELDLVVGRNRWPVLNDRSKYTEAVLMEILRRANVPPLGIAHRAIRSTNLLNYTIPEGSIVLTSLYSIHMDIDYWKDPQEFRPERFLDEHNNLLSHDRYFQPFGFGKRRCLGESLARANLFLFFTALLHNFKLEPALEPPKLDGLDGVTISPHPFSAKLIYRE